MGLVDKIKAGAEQAGNKARETAQEVQTKRELAQAHTDLGKTAFALVDRGEISHDELSAGVDHIRELQSRLAGTDE
jgi:hypothetical protein